MPDRFNFDRVVEVKKVRGTRPSSLLELRSTVLIFGWEPNEEGNIPSKELFLILSTVNLWNCVKLGMLPVKLFELKSRISNLSFQFIRTDISSDSIFLLKSTTRQFPDEGGNKPESKFDEILTISKVVELIFGTEPGKRNEYLEYLQRKF